jgi:hypothetical protein
MRIVNLALCGQDKLAKGVSGPSNLGCWFRFGRREHIFSFGSAWQRQSTGRHHGHWLEGAQARTLGHQSLNRFFLRDLGYERNLFCKITVVEMNHGKLRRGGGSGALQRRWWWLLVVLLLQASSQHGRYWRGGLTMRARHLWRLLFGLKFKRDRALFIGVLIPNHRWQKS